MIGKVVVTLKIKVSMDVKEEIGIGEVVNELDYFINDTTNKITIEDTEITDYELHLT